MTKLTRKYSEIVGTVFVGGEWQDHDLLPAIGDLEAENASLRQRVEALEQEHQTARFALAALVADPSKPDWMPALGNNNPADADCLQEAYDALATAQDNAQHELA